MASRNSGSSGAILAEINVTPLVDVVLVLLVLMMVTATTLATRVFAVELPHAKTGAESERREPFVVAIDEAGVFHLDDRVATDEALRDRARAVGAEASAVVAADGRARHRSVVRALEILRSEHIAKIAIVVRADAE